MTDQDHATRPVIHVVAQSHIDLAWLWRWDPETIHVCCKLTFGQATANMDAYPDYTFSQSQVPLYQATEQHHPGIFKKMEKYIKDGRWEIAGGLFVEFEGAEPCGESIVRQCVLGKRYFKHRFGIDVNTCWQEDAWTHPWQLPQVLAKCGMDSYFFNRGKRRPALFWWRSPDGSRVLAIKPVHALKGRSPFLDWISVTKWVQENARRLGLRDVLVRIGKGDHGGGPSPREIDTVHGWSTKFARHCSIGFDRFDAYVKAVLESGAAKQLPVHASELDCELQGDLTNCGEIKTRNRHGEVLLLAAEKWATIATRFHGLIYPAADLDRAWELLLFNQFHDIIGGSGIPDACKDAHQNYDRIEEIGTRMLDRAVRCIATRVSTNTAPPDALPVVVFNPLAWDLQEIVEIPLAWLQGGDRVAIIDGRGNLVPVQRVPSIVIGRESEDRVIFEANVPATGYSTFHVIPNYKGETIGISTLAIVEKSDAIVIENESIMVEIDRLTGSVGSIIDKQSRRELLDATRRGNSLVAIVDEGDSEGRFVLHHDRVPKPPGKQLDITDLVSLKITERGPVRATIEIVKRYQASTFTQLVSVRARGARVDCAVDIDWHDVHRMIKVAFPLDIPRPTITCHTQFGTIERPADGCEYPAQYWIDVSCPEFGVTLVNDARHGYDVLGSQARISLLRSPTGPALNTDEGRHRVKYAIIPHGPALEVGVAMRDGYAFNHPLVPVATSRHAGDLPASASYLRASPVDIVVEAIKKAFDSDNPIVRSFNSSMNLVEARLEGLLVECTELVEIDMMERGAQALTPANAGEARFKCKPAEIKTIELRGRRPRT